MSDFKEKKTIAEIEDAKVAQEQAVRDLSFLMDVPLNVCVELGRSELRIKDLIQLQKGSVIELEKLAGEPLEILVNGRDVARGEVVVINEKFGIRLTDIINPLEGVSKGKTRME